MLDVLIDQIVDHRAILRRRILEIQERADLLQCHIQATTVADE